MVPGFVDQGGDPLAEDSQRAGSGGPGYFVDEKVPEDTTYKRGVVAMAKAADERDAPEASSSSSPAPMHSSRPTTPTSAR